MRIRKFLPAPARIKFTLGYRARDLGLLARDFVFDLFDAALPAAEAPGPSASKRILFIEDRVPHWHLGSGYPRSNLILTELRRMGHAVTLYPLVAYDEDEASAYSDIPREVEIVLGHGPARLKRFLKERRGQFDLVFVSRPHNMETFKRSLPAGRRPRIVYDAEALFCMRDIVQQSVEGRPLAPRTVRRIVRREVRLTKGSRAVISVSAADAEKFAAHGRAPVFTLAHSVAPRPTPRPFDAREGFLFVGPLGDLRTPNGAAVLWFAREILPLIRERLGAGVKFYVAGQHDLEAAARELESGAVELLGRVEDLTGVYDRARVFVAPSRFAAGVPLKIYEAAAHGLPVVATPLLASQLSWRARKDLLVGADAREFADACVRLYTDARLWREMREGALARVAADCSPQAFAERLERVIEEALRD